MKSKRLLPPIDWLQERAKEISAEKDERVVEAGLRTILEYYEPLNYNLTYESGLWRARKCKDETGFDLFSEMHYPPIHLTGTGRANDEASPLLCVSFTQLTALREVCVKVGDRVQVIAYKLQREKPIRSFTLGEFATVHLRGHGNLPGGAGDLLNTILHKLKFEPGLSFIFLDAFLAALMKGEDEQANGYVHSRVLARIIFERYPAIEAIHYPSVARNGAMNLAVRPNIADAGLSFLGTSVLSISNVFDYGLCRFSELKSATQLASGGRFMWSAANNSLQRP